MTSEQKSFEDLEIGDIFEIDGVRWMKWTDSVAIQIIEDNYLKDMESPSKCTH